MRIESLEYLVSFRELGSIAATAERHFMSSQGMSRLFKQLEKEAGIKLFFHEGKALKLTEAGEELAEKSKDVIASYQQVQDVLSFYADSSFCEESDVTICATPLAAMCLTPLFDLQKPGLFPFVVNFTEANLTNACTFVSASRKDNRLGIVSVPPDYSTNEFNELIARLGLVYLPLLRSEVIALVSASSPIARSSELLPDKYEKRISGSIGIACPYDETVLNQLDETVSIDNIRTATNNLQVLKKQIRRGQVAMFTPKLMLANLRTGKGITWLKSPSVKRGDGGLSPQEVHFGIVVLEDYEESGQLVRVVRYVRETMQRMFKSADFCQYASPL